MKIHYSRHGQATICGESLKPVTVSHVGKCGNKIIGKSNIEFTDDKEKVTCKHCIKAFGGN